MNCDDFYFHQGNSSAQQLVCKQTGWQLSASKFHSKRHKYETTSMNLIVLPGAFCFLNLCIELVITISGSTQFLPGMASDRDLVHYLLVHVQKMLKFLARTKL